MAIHNKAIAQANNKDYGHRNFVMNGNFEVWQRGTSFSNPTAPIGAFTADRWYAARGGFTTGLTTSQNSYGNTLRTIRLQRTTGDTSTVNNYLSTSFETVEVRKLAGKTLTLQYKAYRGANFSGASNLLGIFVTYGTGTDNAYLIGSGFTGSTHALNVADAMTTVPVLNTHTFTLPSNATQLAITFWYGPTGTAGANDWFEVGEVQLEIGSIATQFEYRPYQLELNMCQRYFEIVGGVVIPGGNPTWIFKDFYYKVQKRIIPTVNNITFAVGTGATFNLYDGTNRIYQETAHSTQANFTAWVNAELF